MIVANGQPRGNPLVKAAEVLSNTLAERFQRLEAFAREAWMPMHSLVQ